MATVDPKTLGATTEQESMERFGTPLPGADPASQQGVRTDPNYIGATNFAKLQTQFTPYQIEQATRRDEQGNIFWNPDVNISEIPKTAPPANLDATSGGATTPTAGEISTAGQAPPPPTETNAMLEVSRSISSAAQTFLTNTIDKTVDSLQAQLQEAINAEKEAAQKQRDAATQELDELSKNQFAQDALEAARKKFEVDKTIQQYKQISQNIVDAQAALDQGLVYEQSRPVRMALLTGRSNQLRQQGLAMIGTMQATASMLKGQLDLARTYADDTIEAINMDNARRVSALNTLISLSDKDIVRLDDQEKGIIQDRLASIKEESARIENNKNAVLDLMASSPSAALQGKVLVTDSPEDAMRKMLPFLAEQEEAAFALAAAKARGRGGAGGGAGAGASTDFSKYLSSLNSTERSKLAEAVTKSLSFETRQEAIEDLIANQSVYRTLFGDQGLQYIAQQIDDQFGVPEEGEQTPEEIAAAAEAEAGAPLTPEQAGAQFREQVGGAIGGFFGGAFNLLKRTVTGPIELASGTIVPQNDAEAWMAGMLGIETATPEQALFTQTSGRPVGSPGTTPSGKSLDEILSQIQR